MEKLKHEFRMYGKGDFVIEGTNGWEHNTTSPTDVQNIINDAIEFAKGYIDKEGVVQYTKIYNGVQIYWLHSKDINSTCILKIIPVYEGTESIRYIQNYFNALD